MSSDPSTTFFVQRESPSHVVVCAAPRFDLEGYISNYTGRTQVNRLVHIGSRCVPLAAEALKLAVKMVKQTFDVARYKEIVDILQKIVPDDVDAKIDEDWVDKTTRKVAIETEKMEAALKSYKHNLIKESIRMGHGDLGNHYHASGDLSNAFKSYSRMRDYCTAPKHILDMSLQIIRVCVEQENYMSVQTHVSKIRNLPKTSDEDEALQPKLLAVMGLSHLCAGQYLAAARSFIECLPNLGANFNEIISSNDVACYGALCALASMDRQLIKAEVLDNSNFRNFLELEPHMRRAIIYFHTAKYSNCLQILEEYKNDFLLDIHLQRHVKPLYSMIRSKSIVQYFIPFSCVTLDSMSKAFATPEDELEKELVEMINRKTLEARIDTKNRELLVTKETDMRASVHKDTLAMAQSYERAARMRLVRMNMIRAGLEVKGPRHHSLAQQGLLPEALSGRSLGTAGRYH